MASLAAVSGSWETSIILTIMTSFGGVNQNSDDDMTSFLIWAIKESKISICWWWTFESIVLKCKVYTYWSKKIFSHPDSQENNRKSKSTEES